MAWHGVLGHDEVRERFRRAIRRGRLASSFLFVGPPGIGKRRFAIRLAQALLCQTRPEAELDPCGRCPGCVQVKAGTHPDLAVVEKPADKSFIPVDLLIGDREHRRREGLLHHLALKPQAGGRKVAILDDADHLNAEGANCLLKTLEEPPPRSLLILIGTSPARQLPTIRSRCQLVSFQPLPAEAVRSILQSTGEMTEPAQLERLAAHSGGSVGRALELADPDLWAFREVMLGGLSEPRLQSLPLAEQVSQFVDAAGKEAPPRRARLRQVLGFAAEFYRCQLRALCGALEDVDPELIAIVRRSIAQGGADADQAGRRLERCLQAADDIDRNANQTTLIETWLDGLAAA
ncbi:MAG: DNA polymerase III subunit delta' [Planctomycetota bacterium]